MNRMLKNPIKCGICESKIEKVSNKCHGCNYLSTELIDTHCELISYRCELKNVTVKANIIPKPANFDFALSLKDFKESHKNGNLKT